MEKKIEVQSAVYDLSSIQNAISDYSEISEISYSNGFLYVSGNSVENIQEIFHEFMNYLLLL